MSNPVQSQVRNQLLARLSPDDFALLAPDLEYVKLNRGYVITEPDRLIEWVYFFESGVGSTIAVSPEGQQVEVGLLGRDGFSPFEPILGADRCINRIVMQLPDDSWRMDAGRLVTRANESVTLRTLLLKFVLSLALQGHYTALSNAVHPIDERLARWLLMCDDRVDGGKLELTHEFISIMLAVRRPSVTTALHVLEGNGFIRSERGCIIIRNRRALEDFAGDAYGKPEAEYRRLMGSLTERT
jgi:CRP-like cAMP-binding protein